MKPTPQLYVMPKMRPRLDVNRNVLIRSNCHLYTGEWTPEPGSPQAWLALHYPSSASKRLRLKQHWSGANNCNFVMHGKHNAYDRERIHEGDVFDELPHDARCANCEWYFQQS
jgi:hypothetical protein